MISKKKRKCVVSVLNPNSGEGHRPTLGLNVHSSKVQYFSQNPNLTTIQLQTTITEFDMIMTLHHIYPTQLTPPTPTTQPTDSTTDKKEM